MLDTSAAFRAQVAGHAERLTCACSSGVHLVLLGMFTVVHIEADGCRAELSPYSPQRPGEAIVEIVQQTSKPRIRLLGEASALFSPSSVFLIRTFTILCAGGLRRALCEASRRKSAQQPWPCMLAEALGHSPRAETKRYQTESNSWRDLRGHRMQLALPLSLLLMKADFTLP